jgi:hypothetical protein
MGPGVGDRPSMRRREKYTLADFPRNPQDQFFRILLEMAILERRPRELLANPMTFMLLPWAMACIGKD